MDEGITVDLRGRCQEKGGAFGSGQAEHVRGSERADLERVDRVGVVLRRGCRRREMQHVAGVAADEHAVVDIGLAELEVGVVLKRREVFRRAGDEVVQCQHAHAATEQCLAKVRTDETGPAGDDRTRSGAIRGQCRDR